MRLRGTGMTLVLLITGLGPIAGSTADCLTPGANLFSLPEGAVAVEVPEVELDPADGSGQTTGTQAAALAPTTIPVWVHVLRESTVPLLGGDVADAQIAAQIAVINDAFDGGQPGGEPTPFRFELAGVTRTTNVAWFGMETASAEEAEAKTALHTGDAKTLNVYTANPTQAGGWARFPWSYKHAPELDGIVISYRSLPGGVFLDRAEGDLAVHEVGHWLGLYHTFQGGCSRWGDYVDDTPAEETPATQCDPSRDTCPAPGTDPVHNYMDYTPDSCTSEFTDGQSLRMQDQWTHYRDVPAKAKGKSKNQG